MQAPLQASHEQVAIPLGTRRVRNEARFARWVAIVYLPLSLLVVGFSVFVTGALPEWGRPALLLLAAWGLFAVRLLLERKKLGVRVRIPRSLVVGVTSTFGAGLLGALLIWGGINRLSRTTGVVFLFLGAVLALSAVLAPLFRALDFVVRTVAAAVLGERRNR